MVLPRQYLRVGQSVRNRLFGISNGGSGDNNARFQNVDYSPIQMLISQQGRIDRGRLICIIASLFLVVFGFLLSSIPWVDYLILNNLRLRNGSLSFQYWQKPGIIRLTKVYIFNITNSESFLKHNEKPKFVEVGPFVYRENMEKVNIKFHDNDTVSYQHKKILHFVPELSLSTDLKFLVPNIPLLTLAEKLNPTFSFIDSIVSVSSFLQTEKHYLITLTVEELFFGYYDTLVSISQYIPLLNQKPLDKMALLIRRNGTLDEVHTMYTGKNMSNFGYLNKLNGQDKLPFWNKSPCNDIRASEGSFFPPRDYTKADTVYVYDKDICRILPFDYRKPDVKNDIPVDLYTLNSSAFESADIDAGHMCFCRDTTDCPERGLQDISPCQFEAPVFLSQPHFLDGDPELLNSVDGLTPLRELHQSLLKIQPKLGVPLEAKVRIQLNLQMKKKNNQRAVANFPAVTYPIIWIEEGVDEMSVPIQRWIYLATVIPDSVLPILTYGMMVAGAISLAVIFARAYQNVVFNQHTLEIGMRTFRTRSNTVISGQNRISVSESLLQLNTDEVDV